MKEVSLLRKIEIGGKVYYGKPIYRKIKNDIEISIYILSLASDKFLVLQKQNSITKDFVVTGIDKVYDIIDLLDKEEIKELKKEITTCLEKLEKQCYIKSLKKVDMQKYRGMIVGFYDKNYPMFTILGVKLPELIQEVNKKVAL